MKKKQFEIENELAVKYGFTVVPDEYRGCNLPGKPAWSYFKYKNYWIWECVHNGRISWAVALVEHGYFSKHKYFKSNQLEDAFKYVILEANKCPVEMPL